MLAVISGIISDAASARNHADHCALIVLLPPCSVYSKLKTFILFHRIDLRCNFSASSPLLFGAVLVVCLSHIYTTSWISTYTSHAHAPDSGT
jgi:hypothetical protein